MNSTTALMTSHNTEGIGALKTGSNHEMTSHNTEGIGALKTGSNHELVHRTDDVAQR
jgi:hypothetical protein